MSEAEAMPPENWPAAPMGLAWLATEAFRGGDLRPVASNLARRLQDAPADAAALFDLGLIFQLFGERDKGLAHQRRALSVERVYRQPASGATPPALSLLMFAIPGDFMANTPIEFILQNAGIRLDIAYLRPGGRLPERLPEHDVALVGIGESTEARDYLEGLSAALASWPRPVLNVPRRIIDLARERLFHVLAGANAVEIPVTAEVSREDLLALGGDQHTVSRFLPDAAGFPIIVRPLGSHAGHGLEKLGEAAAVAGYIAGNPAERYFISRFVDYRSADGLYRKYRIALIQGRPFLCHMAISSQWMVHYLNAGMTESAEKRAEEAAVMAHFDDDFALRHAEGFKSLHEAVGLDYFAVDCAESPDGNLLVFEADTAMIIHSMDPPELFPYKAKQMEKAYAAFREMLRGAVGCALP